MNLLNTLHERAVELSKNLRNAELELIEVLQGIDERRYFRILGYSSLFRYCVEGLLLSESQTYRLITIARKSLEIPELKEAIASGKINTSKACRIVSVITPSNKDYWIKTASELSQKELEREISGKRLRPNIKERIKYHSDEWAELTCEISHEVVALLNRAKDVLSTKTQTPCTANDVLKKALQDFLHREDPRQIAERNLARRLKKAANSSKLLCVGRENQRVPIATATKQAVIANLQGQCSQIEPSGKRCPEKRWTQIHHVQPIAMGGGNNLENLTLLCASHHKALHENIKL